MSYRGKKLKRSPAEVVHDIITGHMEEIIAAGGTGCFTKDSSGPAANAIPKSESSKGSNTVVDISSPVQKGHKEPPVVSAPVNTTYGRGHWNERSREQSAGRDRWSSENSTLRASKQSSADIEGAPQSRRHSINIPSEEDDEYARYRQKHSRESSRDYSYRSSERHKDHHRSHSRSRDDRRESKRDYRRESESRWEDRDGYPSTREDDDDTRRQQRYKHDFSDRWESSSDGGFYRSGREHERKRHKGR